MVVAKIRHRLVCGTYAAGEKLREQMLARELAVSRTPVRLALSELEREGLLEYAPNRGFVAKAFTVDHVLNAVEVRERLEGMAAGQLAILGAGRGDIATLEACLAETDDLLAKPVLSEADIARWSDINGVFHETLVQGAGNDVLAETLARIALVPMASPRSFTGMFVDPQRHREAIAAAHVSHRWVLEAIVARDGARAEAMMRQHIHEGRGQLRKLLVEEPRAAGDPRLRRVVGGAAKGSR